MVKIKICGIKSINDILIMNKYKPDYIGFVFVKSSKRYIDINTALECKKALNKEIKSVGVFLNNDIDYIIEIVKKGIIDIIQLHGSEDSNYVRELKHKINIPIIKAYKEDINADFLLLDNINPGSGEKFDWSCIETTKSYFLAGGININNVKEALELKPYAIDVSSGVETNGFKDEKKVEEIIRLVRNYEG
ncbi:MAG: phosphoribosylanthranilate isomerase [Anaeroplasmataceae bacterium]